MPLAGFEPTIPVSKRAKIFHALDRAATVTGSNLYRDLGNSSFRMFINLSSKFEMTILSHDLVNPLSIMNCEQNNLLLFL
jgi:hypothetical protein